MFFRAKQSLSDGVYSRLGSDLFCMLAICGKFVGCHIVFCCFNGSVNSSLPHKDGPQVLEAEKNSTRRQLQNWEVMKNPGHLASFPKLFVIFMGLLVIA